jgi:hypothetical protein
MTRTYSSFQMNKLHADLSGKPLSYLSLTLPYKGREEEQLLLLERL